MYIYEYVAGGNLSCYLTNEKKQLSGKEILNYSTQILSAVNFLYKFGIIHRDLKPENILVSQENNGEITLKITDFGLSKVMGHNAFAFDSYGTLLYIAPEIILNMPYDHRVDLWSVGIIIYLLCFGVSPFVNSDMNQIQYGIVNNNIRYRPVSTSLGNDATYEKLMSLIKTLLIKDFRIRPHIDEVMVYLNNK